MPSVAVYDDEDDVSDTGGDQQARGNGKAKGAECETRFFKPRTESDPADFYTDTCAGLLCDEVSA